MPGVFLFFKRKVPEMTALALPKVLTAEDDPIVRADLRLILEDAGFDVVPDARDGVEAVDLAREHRPDVILLDLDLPRLDGVQATRQILGERAVPIVALTGHSNSEALERAADAGATLHVLKPFSEQQLVTTLREAISDHAELEAEENHLRVLVERMVRQGYSEKQVTRAVNNEASPRLRNRRPR
jgi:two-component system, response regulator PdtaR